MSDGTQPLSDSFPLKPKPRLKQLSDEAMSIFASCVRFSAGRETALVR